MMSMVRFWLTKPRKLRDFQLKVSYIYLFTYPILTATFYLFSTTHPLLSACWTSTVVYLNLFTLTRLCFLPEFKAKARGLHTTRKKALLKSELEDTTSVEWTFHKCHVTDVSTQKITLSGNHTVLSLFAV